MLRKVTNAIAIATAKLLPQYLYIANKLRAGSLKWINCLNGRSFRKSAFALQVPCYIKSAGNCDMLSYFRGESSYLLNNNNLSEFSCKHRKVKIKIISYQINAFTVHSNNIHIIMRGIRFSPKLKGLQMITRIMVKFNLIFLMYSNNFTQLFYLHLRLDFKSMCTICIMY